MAQDKVNLYIAIDADDADEEERERLTRQLMKDLDELEEASVELAKGDKLPKGAMGEPLTTGLILLSLAAGTITGLIPILASWLSRDERRSASLQIGEKKLELTGITKEEQAKVIEWFRTEAGLEDIHFIG